MADELRRRRPAATIGFVGAERGLEQRLVPQSGYPLRTLPLAGLKGASVVGKLRAALAAAVAVMRCGAWMRHQRPDLAIGVGGYASGPAMLAARLLRVKTMVMEQNHFPGATNRWLAPRVDAVCVPSEAARDRLRGNRIVTGNPVRSEFFAIGERPQSAGTEILVFGGSRGARSINRAMCAAVEALGRMQPAPGIAHQTGQDDEAEVRRAYVGYSGEHEIAPFFDDMPERFAAADIVVCRAGASTISELCAAGRPALLVPYPYAADDHQRHNAETLRDAGAALLLADGELSGASLADAIASLADPARRLQMGRAARGLAQPDAALRIADVAEALIEGHDVS